MDLLIKIRVATGLAVLVASSTGAASDTLPDPSSIALPDTTPSRDPKVREEGYKFYYFHKPEVSFAQAHQDFAECRGYLVVGGPAKVPGFIPWGETHRRKIYQRAPMFDGLVVAAMAAIIMPKMQRGLDSNKMRRCMGTRGYDRYAIPEAAWNALNEGEEQQILLMQAKLASGPKPSDEVVTR